MLLKEPSWGHADAICDHLQTSKPPKLNFSCFVLWVSHPVVQVIPGLVGNMGKHGSMYLSQ